MKNVIVMLALSIFTANSFGYSNIWSSDKKQAFIWKNIIDTEYEILPKYEKTDVIGLLSNLWSNDKNEKTVDIIHEHYTKGIHRRSSVAKVQFIPSHHNNRSSLWGGFDFGILRISLTEKPEEGIYKPGIALKALIDGKVSANVSMLVNLDGYASENVFSKNFSNIVPDPKTAKGKLGVALFRLRSKYPTAIKVDLFSKYNQLGEVISEEKSIIQVYFVPSTMLKINSNFTGDPRKYLNEITQGTTLFHVYGRTVGNYEYQKNGEYVEYLGDLVLNSEFVSSSFGDNRLFFNHEFVD